MAKAVPVLRLALLAMTGMASFAGASVRSEEFVPARGKGHAVVMVSGAFGAGVYRSQARRAAAMGYHVLLIDGRDLVGDEAAGLRAAIARVRGSPHALPGKIAMIGFSLGGGQLLSHAAAWPGEVAAIVVMYPATATLGDPSALAQAMRVPVLMLAGEADRSGNCCTIERARQIAAAARSLQRPVVLRSYAGIGHDFVIEGTDGFHRRVAADAWHRTAVWLNRHFGRGDGNSRVFRKGRRHGRR